MQSHIPERNFVVDMGELEAKPEHTREEIAKALDREVAVVGEDGYVNEIWAGTTHPRKGWIGWVEHREKTLEKNWVDVNYFLRALVDGKLAIDWTIETYNPFFGCFVGYIAWHGDYLVMGYAEKHDCYVCALSIAGEVQRVKLGAIGTQWCVLGDILAFRSIETRGITVRRLRLPELTELPPLSEEQAIAEQILRSG